MKNKIKTILYIFPLVLLFTKCSGKTNNEISDKKTPEHGIVISGKEPIKIDTLLSNDYFYTFSINEDEILFVEKRNEVFSFKKGQEKNIEGKIPTTFEVNKLLHNSSEIIAGIGDINIDSTFLLKRFDYDKFKIIPRLEVKEILENIKLFCIDIHSHPSNYRFFIYDTEQLDTVLTFPLNETVIHSRRKFYAYTKESEEVKKYSEELKLVEKITYKGIKTNNPIYFSDNYYLSIKDFKLYKIDLNGNIINEWELAKSYYHKYVIKNESFQFYGWLETDKEKDLYYFVMQEIKL